MIVQAVGALAIFVSLGALYIGVRQFNEQQRVTAAQTREQQWQDSFNEYLNDMSTLVLEYNLPQSKPGSSIRAIADARTLTALRYLDGAHKGALTRYLWEAGLIRAPRPILDIYHADLNGAVFNNANLFGIDLSSVGMSGADFENAGLSGADISRSNLDSANLSGSELDCSPNVSNKSQRTCANLSNAYMMNSVLVDANLSGANFSGANLAGANLAGADLSNANLSGADLIGADLTGANLNGADLRRVTYNIRVMAVQNSQRKSEEEAPTVWPARFDINTSKAICADC